MFEIFDYRILNNYLAKNDPVLEYLNDSSQFGQCTSHKWLKNNINKRAIFFDMYWDILNEKEKRILDVGGGLSSFSDLFFCNNNYTLVDIMAHDTISTNFKNIFNCDWLLYPNHTQDLVIANDIFPNVDQRLELFLEKFIPISKIIKLSLTFYDNGNFYKVKRVDAEEILYIVPWNGKHLVDVLDPISSRIPGYNRNSILEIKNKSLFNNGRQICLITITGDGE